MRALLRSIRHHRTLASHEILFRDDQLRIEPRFTADENSWNAFLNSSLGELRELCEGVSTHEMLGICEMQCYGKHTNELCEQRGRRETSTLSSSVVTRRWQRPDDLYNVQGLPFLWGMREPIRSSKAKKQVSSELLRKLRYLHDVVHIKSFVVLEERFFGPESEAWKEVSDSSATLIAMVDWRLPSSDTLCKFGLTLQQTASEKRNMAVHCIAGNGRTALSLMFTFMFVFRVFDTVQLMLELAHRYKKKAAVEILTMLDAGKFTLTLMLETFYEAYKKLRDKIDPELRLFQRLEDKDMPCITSLRPRPLFTRHERERLERHNIVSRRAVS